MRITNENLLKLARTTVETRVEADRHITTVYATGSLVLGEPLLGGAGDIDLIFVHDSKPDLRREVVRLTDDIHLDIGHTSQADYSQPRKLRIDPWLGSFLCEKALVLHDRAHWYDFTQASVSTQYYRPENVMQRVRRMAADARSLWMMVQAGQVGGSAWLPAFLQSLNLAGNAVACLSGPPLTERRFLQQLYTRAQAAGIPDLGSDISGLITGEYLRDEDWQDWLEPWRKALAAASSQPDCPPRLHACRQNYYIKAAEELWKNLPAAAVWIMTRTWSQARSLLPEEHASVKAWNEPAHALMLDVEHLEERLNALDEVLDKIDVAIDGWARKNGIETVEM